MMIVYTIPRRCPGFSELSKAKLNHIYLTLEFKRLCKCWVELVFDPLDFSVHRMLHGACVESEDILSACKCFYILLNYRQPSDAHCCTCCSQQH